MSPTWGFGFELRRTYLALHRQFKAAVAQHGITPQQYVVLTVLFDENDLTQKDICARIHADANTMTGILSRLEEKRWITKRVHETDGRAVRVHLTSSGRRMQKRIRGIAGSLHEKALSRLGERQKENLLRYLTIIHATLSADDSE